MRLTVITSFNSLTIRTELDFKSDCLFRMCSVVTNLVTSIEFQPIRCATMLFHFGRTRNVYIAIRNILLSSTAESSATSGYVAKKRPELVEMWNGLGIKPSLFQTVVLNNVACNHESFSIINFIFLYFRLFFLLYYSNYSLYGKIFVFIYCVGAGITTLMSISHGSDRTFFLSKDGKDAVREGRSGQKGVYFPPESACFPLVNNMIKVLFPICTLIWRVNNYVYRQ